MRLPHSLALCLALRYPLLVRSDSVLSMRVAIVLVGILPTAASEGNGEAWATRSGASGDLTFLVRLGSVARILPPSPVLPIDAGSITQTSP